MSDPAPDPLREAIYRRLVGDSTLVGLLSSPEAVRHRLSPGDAFPYLIFQAQVPGTPTRTFGTSSDQSVWLIKGVCDGFDASPAEAIDARCRELFDEVRFDVDGHTVTSLREGKVDVGEPKDGELYQHVGSLYRIWT